MPSDDSTASRAEPNAAAIDWPAELGRHRRWLRTVALARVGDAAAADDVMQEVSVTALQKGDQLRDRHASPVGCTGSWSWPRCSSADAKADARSCSIAMQYVSHRPMAWLTSPIRSVGFWPTSERQWFIKR